MATGIYGGSCVETHHVYITDRGGQRRIAELVDITQVKWARVRDEVSEASILVQGGACAAQASILRGIEPKRHEMVIYRGDERVWEGPITRVGWHSDSVEIAARDVAEYLYGRPLSQTWNNNHPYSTEVTTRIHSILDYEMMNSFSFTGKGGVSQTVPAWEKIDPPANVLPHLVVHHFTGEARTSAKTKPFEMSVGEHLDNMAHTGGIDYTVVGRALHIWDVSRNIGQTRTVTEADFFGEVIVTAYGSDFAAIAFAVASDGRAGGAGASNGYYGPWTKMFTVFGEQSEDTTPPSDEELISQAERNLSGRSPVPVEVRIPDNSSVRLSPGFDITDMVPGVLVPLRATLNSRVMSQNQKIHRVEVTETEKGENIALTLVVATKEDPN